MKRGSTSGGTSRRQAGQRARSVARAKGVSGARFLRRAAELKQLLDETFGLWANECPADGVRFQRRLREPSKKC
jgi:hypothetical protein